MIRHIFSINTGRSGSAYLSRIFQNAEACHAVHEPPPIGNGPPMRRFLAGDPRPMQRVLVEKLARIRAVTESGKCYVETNHCFIKGFGWLLPQHIPQGEIGVVILRREPGEIVDSMLRTDCTPLVRTGRDWIMLPTVAHARVAPPRRFPGVRLTYEAMRLARAPFRGARYYAMVGLKKPQVPDWIEAYEREALGWYVAETEARAREYQRRFPGISYFETDVRSLNELASVEEMLRFFGLQPLPGLREAVGKPVNLKSHLNRPT